VWRRRLWKGGFVSPGPFWCSKQYYFSLRNIGLKKGSAPGSPRGSVTRGGGGPKTSNNKTRRESATPLLGRPGSPDPCVRGVAPFPSESKGNGVILLAPGPGREPSKRWLPHSSPPQQKGIRKSLRPTKKTETTGRFVPSQPKKAVL